MPVDYLSLTERPTLALPQAGPLLALQSRSKGPQVSAPKQMPSWLLSSLRSSLA
jgi:hypothetical protein